MTDHYTYRITWSAEDREHLGLCAEFPSLSWLAPTPARALAGIRKLVGQVIEDMRTNGEPVPVPLADRTYSGKFMVRVPPPGAGHQGGGGRSELEPAGERPAVGVTGRCSCLASRPTPLDFAVFALPRQCRAKSQPPASRKQEQGCRKSFERPTAKARSLL